MFFALQSSLILRIIPAAFQKIVIKEPVLAKSQRFIKSKMEFFNNAPTVKLVAVGIDHEFPDADVIICEG